MRLISLTHSSKIMEWHNSSIITLTHAIYGPNVYKKLSENQVTTNFIYLISTSFVTISHINYWDQVDSWEIFWKFWNGPLCRNKSAPFPLLNVALYRQSNNTDACATKLSKILSHNIDTGVRGIELRICFRYCILIWICRIRW